MAKTAGNRYQVYQSSVTGDWYFRFVSKNNRIIAYGEGYRNKKDCLDAVRLLKESGMTPIVELDRKFPIDKKNAKVVTEDL